MTSTYRYHDSDVNKYQSSVVTVHNFAMCYQ